MEDCAACLKTYVIFLIFSGFWRTSSTLESFAEHQSPIAWRPSVNQLLSPNNLKYKSKPDREESELYEKWLELE